MAVIQKANDTAVLMKLLCKELGLSTRCTHIQFVEAFSHTQSDAKVYERELYELAEKGMKQQLTEAEKESELVS